MTFHSLWPKLAILVWALLAAAAPAWGQALPRLDASLDGRPLAPHLAVLADPGGRLGIAEVSGPDRAGQFRAWRHAALDLGLSQGAVWARLALSPGAPPAEGVRVWLLELDKPIVNQIDIFCPVADPARPWLHIASGCERPRPPQAVTFRTNVLTLPQDLDLSRPLYVRLQSGISLSMQMRLWTARSLAARVFHDSQVFGVLYGVLGALILFNLVIFLSLRDSAYLAYVCYVVAMLSGQLVLHGQIPAVLAMPRPLLPQLQAFLLGATMFFAAVFTRQFLSSRVYAPFWDRLLNFFIYAPVAMMALVVVGRLDWANSLGYLVALLGPPHAVCTAVACWRAGFKAARTFLIAWSVLLAATFVFILFSLGVLPPRSWAPYVLPLGVTLESILLTLALADRIRQLRRDRERLDQDQRRLRELSVTDGLTGLHNRRYFDSRLTSELDHARRLGRPLALVMLDLDGFKTFNDACGHQMGDRVLQALAEVLRQGLREGDRACRYGGEEFAVIMPDADLAGAALAAERIRARAERNLAALAPEAAPAPTLSLGVAQLAAGDDAAALVQRADRALYQAKAAGKNRVELGR